MATASIGRCRSVPAAATSASRRAGGGPGLPIRAVPAHRRCPGATKERFRFLPAQVVERLAVDPLDIRECPHARPWSRRSTRAPVRSISALVATVVPCTRPAISANARSAARRRHRAAPGPVRLGTDGVLDVVSVPDCAVERDKVGKGAAGVDTDQKSPPWSAIELCDSVHRCRPNASDGAASVREPIDRLGRTIDSPAAMHCQARPQYGTAP